MEIITPYDPAHLQNVYDRVQNTDTFNSNPAYDELEDIWSGGVGDFGDPEAASVIQAQPDYYDYRDHLVQAVREHLGDPFTAYRLITPEQLEDWAAGADIGPMAVAVDKRQALGFRKFAHNAGKKLVLIQITVPAEAVIMRGKFAESELVIDGNDLEMSAVRLLREVVDAQQMELSLQGGHSHSPITSKHVSAWRNQMCALAQKVYNDWDQSDKVDGDFQVGFGGICDMIADKICDVLGQYGVECMSSNTSVGENHTSVIANLADGVFDIDIPPHVYETGSAYTWHKIPNVIFDPNDVSIYQIARPISDEEFSQHYGNE